MKYIKRTALAAFTGILIAGSMPAQVIDTTTGFVFNAGFGAFGEGFRLVGSTSIPAIQTMGQTFRTPAGFTQLNAFTFWVGGSEGPDAIDFAAYVMEWNGALTRATGPVLYQSTQQIRATGLSFAYDPYVFTTGGLLLDASKQYVAFLSTSAYLDGIQGTSLVSVRMEDVYAFGQTVFALNGSSLPALSTSPWTTSPMIGDLAFRAQFSAVPSAVPEPSSYGLIGSALLAGLVALRRGRKHA